MRLAWNEDQRRLQEMARKFVQKEAPLSRVRQLEAENRDFARDFYEKSAEVGLLQVALPEQDGGSGDWLDAAIWFEALGGNLVATPQLYSVLLAVPLLKEAVHPSPYWIDQVRKMVQGVQIVTFALFESPPGDWREGCETELAREGNEWLLRGRKSFVPYADESDGMLVLARRGAMLGLSWVPEGTPGVEVVPHPTQGNRKIAEVWLRDVKLPESYLIGEGEDFVQRLSKRWDAVRILHAAWGVGSAQGALDKVTQYVKERVQFGRPVGTFQGLQYQLVDVHCAVEEARWLTYYAAWCVCRNMDWKQPAILALLRAGDALEKASAVGSRLHGGYGFTLEYDIQLYFRRAKLFRQEFGRIISAEKRRLLRKFSERESFAV